MPSELIAPYVAGAGPLALVVARATGLAWTAPALSAPGLEWRFKLVLGAVLGLALAPAVGLAENPVTGGGGLAAALVGEVLLGAGLGWSAALVVAGARQAGELVGAQGGFSPAALFDPDAGDEMTAPGHLYGLVALAVFLGLDGPLALVRALLASFRTVPPGGGFFALTGTTAAVAFAKAGEALALALRAAAPAALALAMAGVALGLLGKAAPSLQLFALAIPVRAALGLLLVLLSLATLAATLAAAWGAWAGVLP